MLELLTAFGLDRAFGDPVYHWHPVRVIGRFIKKSETWIRAHVSGGWFGGLLLAIFVPSVTFLGIWFLSELAGQIHPVLKKLVTIYFVYSALAVKDLESEGRQIYTHLLSNRLEKARENLARIVGRDTKDLSESEVIRGAVEAVAESFVDGVFSPLFFAAIGGAPLVMTYKAINTLDSMVGRKTSEYREFGAASAKLDEIVNWIPARISWLLIGVGAFFVNGRNMEAWRIGFEDGAASARSNSVVPEAAFAGALGIELGGTNFYGGEKVETRKMGYPMRALEKEDVRRAYRLMKSSAWAALIFALILSSIASLFVVKIVDPIAV